MIYLIAGIIAALFIAFLFTRRQKDGKKDEPAIVADDCCGAHEVCESETLLSSSDKVEYYDDEELDAYKQKAPSSYTDEQIEQFREVLITLKEREVSGWLKSLQLRQITPPPIIREEALMIVADRRNGKS